MAQYNLSAGTQFKPFSYERYLQPLVAYNQAIQSQEDLASDLSTQANYWGNLANQQTDKKTYAQYKKYADDLKAQSDLLAEKGLYEGSRRAMLDLKNRYATEMVPIENAYKRREEQAKLQQQMKNAHPDIRYGKMASTTSLDEYLNNSAYDATDQVASLDQVKNTVAMVATALSKEAHANPNIRKTLQQILPYQYYAELERNGFKSEEVYKAIHSAEGSPILKSIVDDAIKGAGIDKWDNAAQMYQEAYNYASPALYNAVGTTKFGPVTDQAGLATLQADLSLRNQKQQQKWEEQQKQQEYQMPFPINTEEVTFGADSKDAETIYNNMKSVLGISGGKGTKVGVHDIQVSSTDKNGYATKAINKNGTNNFRTMKKNGYMMTEQEFMNQGKTAQDRKALQNYYRNRVVKAIESVDAKGSKHISNIYKKGQDFLTRGGATYQKMAKLTFGDNKKVFDNKVAGMIDATAGAYTLGSDGISGWRKGKRVSGADLKNEMSENGDLMSYHISLDSKHPGVVFSTAKGRYFVPSQNMGSAAQQGFKHYYDASKSIQATLNEIKKNRKSYVSQYGEARVRMWEKQNENALQAATADAISNIGFGIAGEYADPSAKILNQ